MPRYDVPKFADYSGAIQANQSMANSFANLGNQSQDYLKMEEQKNHNAWAKSFEEQKFDETKNQNKIANDNADRAFNYGAMRDGVKDNQWQQNFDETKTNNAFDRNYKTNMFNHTVNQDNINNSHWEQSFNRPDYATFNSVDDKGSPILSLIDKRNGNVVNTGQQVYNEAKKLTPEQSMYYLEKTDKMKQDSMDRMLKELPTTRGYSNLSDADKLSAENYVKQNGKLPVYDMKKGLFSDTYTMPVSEDVKKQQEQQLAKYMKSLGMEL